jgi:hypothetical protein
LVRYQYAAALLQHVQRIDNAVVGNDQGKPCLFE